MYRPLPGPFLGSMPSPALPGARLGWLLDGGCSAMALVAAGGVWAGALLAATGPGGAGLDIVMATKLSCAALLLVALAGMWLIARTAEVPRLAFSLLCDLLAQRFSGRSQRRAVMLPAAHRRAAPGLLGLLARRWRGRAAPPIAPDAQAALGNAALRDCRTQARDLSGVLAQEAGRLAEMSAEIEAGGDRLAADTARAGEACAVTQAALAHVTDRIVALTGAVSATTGELQRAAGLGASLADQAMAGQQRIAGLDDRSAGLLVAVEQIEALLQRVGKLARATAMAAARGGAPAQAFCELAASIQEAACGALAALARMGEDIAEMGRQTGEAARAASEISARVSRHHELGLALAHAVGQQAEAIASIIRQLDEAQSGFVTLRACVEAVSRHGPARLARAEALREAAARLPVQAEGLAALLRAVPDFAPPEDYGF